HGVDFAAARDRAVRNEGVDQPRDGFRKRPPRWLQADAFGSERGDEPHGEGVDTAPTRRLPAARVVCQTRPRMPTPSEDLAPRSAPALLTALRRRDVSSRELLDLHLARIARANPALNAVVPLDADGARRRADAADAARARGDELGPLHGLPMTIKDSFE